MNIVVNNWFSKNRSKYVSSYTRVTVSITSKKLVAEELML